jgi:Sec-independent protein translocase protein TatA
MGEALACFIHSTAEIEVNLPIAFGKATTPEMVGDLTERYNQYEFPEATGVILHEAFHARYSEWNYELLDAETKSEPKVREAFMLLEESRIEGLAVFHYPENALFLRASSMGLSFAEAETSMEKMSATGAFAHLAGLTLARVSAGVLDEFDVAGIYNRVAEVLGEKCLKTLEEIWTKFQTLNNHTDLMVGVALARKWVEAIKERAEERGEPAEPEFGEGVPIPQELAEALSEIMEALGEAMEETKSATAEALSEQQQDENLKEEIKERQSQAKTKEERKAEADKVFSHNSTLGQSGSSSRLESTRPPKGEERAGAVKLAQMLEKAKYVERSATEIATTIPQGRLRTRAVVQKKALEAKGIRSDLPTWRATKHRHTTDPILSIGVMVDVSGSMGSAMNPMASMAWILSEAGRRVQAKTAMVYYGSGVFPTLKVGQHLEEVKVWTAPDGTEEFGQAYKALDGVLGLTYAEGVKLLVIVSDGHYRPDQEKEVRKALAECDKAGVGVLWITPAECRGGNTSLISGTSATHLNITDTASIATAIGRSATEALAKIGGRV